MAVKKEGGRLSPAEVETILRRASELGSGREDSSSISPEVLVQVAAAIGIPEENVRRAISDLASERAAEPDTLSRTLYGSARLRVVREIDRPAGTVRELLEDLLKKQQGLKLRRTTSAGSHWDSGDLLGTIRRTLDFSDERPLLKAKSVEVRVRSLGDARCEALLTADLSNQRGEYFSLGSIFGVTLAVPAAIAGVQEPLFFLAVLPALAAPGFGFKLAYRKGCAGIRRALDDLFDAAEEGAADLDRSNRERRPIGRVQNLKPIPRFTVPERREE